MSSSPNLVVQAAHQATASTLATSINLSPASSTQPSHHQTQQQQILPRIVTQQSTMSLSVRDILAHKSTMFNFKLPSDRTMYESSLIYCDLCDFSCDLTDKSAIICHYLAKHPDDSIVYSYLWPQMEQNPITNTYKVKYYLIKANLKIRTKETQAQGQRSDRLNLESIVYPASLLEKNKEECLKSDTMEVMGSNETDVQFMMNKILDWCEINLIVQGSSDEYSQPDQPQEDVQELEEEQEVQEVEMYGEDSYDTTGNQNTGEPNQLDNLVKLSSSASYYYNQQKLMAGGSTSSASSSYLLDNNYLVHLLAINKSENAFRVKQIHDYYGGCFICGIQVEFNMKHYQNHFNSEMSAYICLHCNYKEYKQEQLAIISGTDNKQSGQSKDKSSMPSSSCTGSSICSSIDSFDSNLSQLPSLKQPYQVDSGIELSAEEKNLQNHMTSCHNMDFDQILEQHQQLQQSAANMDSNNGVVVIESTPMNDMYLSLQIKSIKYIDDDLLRKDEFRADMVYSCPICCGDINCFNPAHLNQNLNSEAQGAQHYSQYENITFEYLVNHFLVQHQLKTIPLFVCTQCNCVRVSLIDAVYHYLRSHFNKPINIGLCAYNIYDKIQNQINQLNQTTETLQAKGHNRKSAGTASPASIQSQLHLTQIPVAQPSIYGSGPLIYCVTCNENFPNEAAFIRHSFLFHLLDPNINLNWYKVYAPANLNPGAYGTVTLQQIAAAMAMADLPNDQTVSIVDQNGNVEQQQRSDLNLMYECPLCLKSVQSKDSISRHLLYHAMNEHYEYELSCSSCNKQLLPTSNLAECLLHTREFRTHRLSINYHKYILSSGSETDAQPKPMVACVLCGHESANLLSCMSHIMLDHFSYDSTTIKIKRFVNYMLNNLKKINPSVSLPNAIVHPASVKGTDEELVQYFNDGFPSLVNEVITCLIAAASKEASNLQTNLDNTESALSAQTHSNNSTASQPGNNKPDVFFDDIKCFKCGKFSTKLKQSLFQHLNQAHGFDFKIMDKQYDLLIQRQLQVIDEQQLVSMFQKQQSDILAHQQVILKETKEKNELQQQQQQQRMVMLTDNQQLVNVNQQQQQEVTYSNVIPVQQQQQTTSEMTTHLQLNQQQQVQMQQQQQNIMQQQTQQTLQNTQNNIQTSDNSSTSNNNSNSANNTVSTPSQIDKIQSTIDQVLLHICKEDYDGGGNNNQKEEPMMVDNTHQQSQVTVTVQPPEAENLFVFKCNLCEPYSTDDATQLLEHYKLSHQVELTIADSSTLLAAAVAAFQTGHTIEMTGAILNTLSSVTDENGLTIISGEEVPVHTTVQYKCTICQNIFYEKQYIVQHLLEAHNFEIDVSYFEEIEMQQQEQLQQKIYEQQQEQLMMQQQQQQIEGNNQQQAIQDNKTGEQQQQVQQHQVQQVQQTQVQQQQVQIQQQQQQQQSLIQTDQNNSGTITDETAAMMMMMMNNGGNQQQAILIQNGQQINGIETAQLVQGQDVFNSNSPITLSASNLIQNNLPQVQQPQQQQKEVINYTCTYCTFGADKLKKMSDHLKQAHAYREKTCMDNVRQQLIRLPNEDIPSYQTSSNLISNQPQQQQMVAQPIGLSGSQTVAANLALSRQQQQQQQQQHNLQKNNTSSTIIDNLSSSLINLTSSIAAQNAMQPVDPSKQHINQIQGGTLNQQPVSNGRGRRSTKSSLKQSSNQHRSGSSNTTIANVLKQQQQQQLALQQQQQQQLAQSSIKTPTVLTMDANSQIIIDFNQSDDLLCSYCDYTINNLNYMRTHIKIKHKNLAITFQNKVTYKFYTIVEWPLTSVPTLTPANQSQTQETRSETISQQQQQPQLQQSQQTQQQIQQTVQQNSDVLSSMNIPSTQGNLNTEKPLETPNSASSINDSISSTIRQKIQGTVNTPCQTPPSTPSAATSTTKTTNTEASNSPNPSGGVNINSVNTILKKLGVNVSTTSSPLSSLISSIGTGNVKHTSNNSVVNINLNVLKDVNIDEMIDDDDDEERKFLIKELEKKANNKKGITNGITNDLINDSGNASSGLASGSVASTPGSTAGGVKRSRSNSSSLIRTNPLSPTTNTSVSQSLLLSQLNITLNCHYCWAQFQLNVSKNLKNSIQQKENGKYMQHLAMHLNAPYKCNECSYPIMDTKTFYKHKQFYKHDEKTCIMVDNDINLPTTGNAQAKNETGQVSSASSTPRRKTLIATRLKQYQQNMMQQKNQELENSGTGQLEICGTESGEIQFSNDRDSFKCALCYGDDDYAPSTSVSTLNKQPTHSTMGASNFSFDKEQVLKHVLIVHLSFLAYKCDTCTQFYAFDEPQTKQHAALVHQCGTGQLSIGNISAGTDSTPTENQTCHFKLIKTEEEINLAINKAQQFINKLPASSQKTMKSTPTVDGTRSTKALASLTNVSIEAQPKYKCCRCVQTPAISGTQFQPIVLYTYQDALDHVMQVHMTSGQTKKDKKLNYELELFEQNLEDLLASETGQTTTITVGSSSSLGNSGNNIVSNNLMSEFEENISDDDVDNGDFSYDDYFNEDLSEWNVIMNEAFNNSHQNILTNNSLNNSNNQSPNSLSANRKQKRFKTNNNTSITMQQSTSSSSLSDTENNISGLSKQICKSTGSQNRRFYFKPHLVYKCQLCSRKMHQFDYNHWLQHDLENHHSLYKASQQQQYSCFKCQSISNQQKTFTNFTKFVEHYKQEHLNDKTHHLSSGELNILEDLKLINCLVCGAELKCTYVDMLKHFQSEHGLNLFDLKLNLTDLELIHTLQIHNQVHLSQSVKVRRRCYIRIPPLLINSSVAEAGASITKSDLIDKELKLLSEIYKEQIIEKQIVSWLNSEQFLRRSFNYNSYVCIICNATKSHILETHYNANKSQLTSNTAAVVSSNVEPTTPTGNISANRHQFYSDEMKTVVLTNHILSHFNEYCYRCMSCKISWPDRTQLLKHAQECSNSQVVRTKTKYKLKANCRLQLKFYLQTYLDYWQYEKCLESKTVDQLKSLNNMVATSVIAPVKDTLLDCKIFLNDIILNKSLMLNASGRFNLSSINLADGKRILLKDDEGENKETKCEIETDAETETEVKAGSSIDVDVENMIKPAIDPENIHKIVENSENITEHLFQAQVIEASSRDLSDEKLEVKPENEPEPEEDRDVIMKEDESGDKNNDINETGAKELTQEPQDVK